MRLKDETGKRYGRLVVIKRAGIGTGGYVMWRCKCDCGGEKIINGSNLRQGATQSCGCLAVAVFHINRRVGSKKRLPPSESAFRQALYVMKKNAKKRDLAWELSKEEAVSLMLSNCHYCGSPPSNLRKSEYGSGDFSYNGIDRKDNSVGYISENVVPSCFNCNRAKATMSVGEFLSWIDRLIAFRSEKT